MKPLINDLNYHTNCPLEVSQGLLEVPDPTWASMTGSTLHLNGSTVSATCSLDWQTRRISLITF